MQPFWALISAQLGFGLPSIGGKDSMSGSFNEIDVPPTLVFLRSGCCQVIQDVITPELKKAGTNWYGFVHQKDAYDLPIMSGMMDQYENFHEDIKGRKRCFAMHLTVMACSSCEQDGFR